MLMNLSGTRKLRFKHTPTQCKSLIYEELYAIRNTAASNEHFDAVKGENRLSMEHLLIPIHPVFQLACSSK